MITLIRSIGEKNNYIYDKNIPLIKLNYCTKRYNELFHFKYSLVPISKIKNFTDILKNQNIQFIEIAPKLFLYDEKNF